MKTRLAWKPKPLLLVLLVVVIVSGLLFIHHHKPAQLSTPTASAQQNWPWTKHNLSWHRVIVTKGDSLIHIFSQFQVSYHRIHKMLGQPNAKKYLGELYIGQTFYLYVDLKKELIILKYPINKDKTLYVYRDHQKINTVVEKKPLTTALIYKSGIIKRSFSAATRDAGLTYHMTLQLNNIFAGTVNFNRLHAGDRFNVLYKEYYLNGKKDHPGNIIAASFTHYGKTYKAVRFTYPHNHTGYYTPKGRGVEPLFLKAPVNYKRISGHFTFHRYDPVLRIMHPHLGIDYAAAYGTPIKSIGDGKVIFRGKKGGYGKAVVIRYSRKYRALYGHMSHIATHLRIHKHVKKGQIIGYVGSTGWSTGPHLHFEMYVYGIPRNPLKMKFVGGKSIPKNYLHQFHKQAKALLTKLKLHKGPELAYANHKNRTLSND